MSRPSAVLRRVVTHPILPALAALLWLLLRSGRKPTRLSYPCQQAALGSTTVLLGVPVVHGLLRLSRRLPLRPRHAIAIGTLFAAVALAFVLDPVDRTSIALVQYEVPRADYEAALYLVEDVGMPEPDRHPGVDDLVACMADGGLNFYRSPTGGEAAGPDGIVGSDHVVAIKVNQQWAQRGGTNTDVLRGIIRRVVEHPDGFTGEVVVVENTQNYGTMDWAQSNAEDTSQSVVDVVNDFVLEGWPVSAHLWDPIRTTSVNEYSTGDMADGYIVNPILDPESQMRVSYPKFRSTGGEYVSLRYGIWDTATETYDNDRLTFINVPVLKCHSIYGVTASVKNHVGTMTTSLSTITHSGVGRGGCGSFLAEAGMPDLNILDCIYILAAPGSGPSCSYAQATRVDKLVAGLDPIALDMWAVANILVPTILDNGFTSYPAQDPENPSSTFRSYLDLSMNEILLAGIDVTNDLGAVTAHECRSVDVDPPEGNPPAALVPRAHPNPFRSTTTLLVASREAGATAVEIYDASGRLVRRLDTLTPQGDSLTASWDGRDASGRRAAAGLYYYRPVGSSPDVEIAPATVTLLR